MIKDNLVLYYKLLSIYRELLLKPVSSENVMNLYAEYLKLTTCLGTNQLQFIEIPKGFKYGNCYTYALDLKCPTLFYNTYYLFDKRGMNFDVGFISDVNNRSNVFSKNEKELLERLYTDCEFLKIRLYDSGINQVPRHEGYIVFIYKDKDIESTNDFHFVRQNYDGSLSHKNGYNGVIEQLGSVEDADKNFELIRALEIVKPIR